MEEIWKDVIDFESTYEVSSFGNVRNKKTNRILKPTKHNGYFYLHLYKNNKSKTVMVHRLVANAFILNPSKKLEVNHKDKYRTNNYVSNLEWSTREENNFHKISYDKKPIDFTKLINEIKKCVPL